MKRCVLAGCAFGAALGVATPLTAGPFPEGTPRFPSASVAVRERPQAGWRAVHRAGRDAFGLPRGGLRAEAAVDAFRLSLRGPRAEAAADWPVSSGGAPRDGSATSASDPDPGAAIRGQLEAINRRRIRLTGYGMGALLTWAVGNVAVGVVGNVVAEDERVKALHQGNWGWNVVNLVIGGIGLYNAIHADPTALDYQKTRDAADGLKLAFAINSVLDCVYISTGAWLWERGLRTDEPVMTGWGQALVLQGGFLLAFDVVMWGLSLSISSEVDAIDVKLVPTGNGAMVAGRF